MQDIHFFPTAEDFRKWLEKNHDKEKEVIVGLYKAKSGKMTLNWSDAVDEALCYGWIDGIGRRIDDERRSIRFTPRRPNSIWSKINVDKVARLSAEGRMKPEGLRAFERRKEAKTGIYSHESEAKELSPEQVKRFKANKKAWEFFSNQPPSYRKTAIHLVLTAKREETREKRFRTLIDDSAAGLRIAPLRR